MKFGIGNKLFLGFGSLILLSVITSIVLWDRFQDIADTQTLVIEDAIPAMNEAQRLAELSAGIIASAPELIKVRNEQERKETFQDIKSRIRQVDELLSKFDRHGFNTDQVENLKTTIGQIIENVTQQDSLVMIRLKREHENQILTENSINAVKQLSLIAESLVANTGASTTAVLSTVYDLIEPAAEPEKVYEVLDRLIEVEFDDLERMFELRLRSSILMDQIQQFSTELDPEALMRIDQDIQASLAILGRRIEDINDPGRFEQANDLKAQLVLATRPNSRNAFLTTRQTIISARAKSDSLSSDNHARLEVLNTITASLVEKSQQVIEQATAQAEGSVYRARIALVLFGILTPLILLTIFSIYVRGIIKRITTLESATHALAEGDYSIDIDTRGADELSEMANAVQVFKENAIEKVRLDQDLKRHKQDLEKTVKERTLQLQQMNQDLTEVAAKHEVARKQAEQASRAKTTFLAMMSHEIRTPMNGILGTLRLLNNTHLSDKQRYFTHVINSATRSLLDILNDVLDFSSIETGKIEISRQPFDLKALIDEIITLLAPAAEEKGLQLLVSMNIDTNRHFQGDAGKLRQVLLNLITNAIKFTEQGYIELRVSEKDSSDIGVSLRFDIVDTGIGIAENMVETIFEPFTQVDTSLSKKEGGIGLGLAICQRLVMAMQGTIHASVVPEGGTCMTVKLDLDYADEGGGSMAKGFEDSVSRTSEHKLNVLLVEDDEINRMISQSFLEEFGHTVTSVAEAETAINKLKQSEFDIMLTDISLPGMDGLELTKAVRALPDPQKAQIPIVAISAHVLKQEVDYYQSSGITAFLGKPYEPEKLNEVLQRSFNYNLMGQPAMYQVPPVDKVDCHDILLRDAEVIGFDVVNEMVELFFNTSRETVEQIHNLIGQKSWAELAKQAHKLKSAASSIGLNDLRQLSHELETAALENSFLIGTLQEKLDSIYEESCRTLARVWSEIQKSQAEPMDS